MGETSRVRNAFDTAYCFLHPVKNKEERERSRGISLIEILELTLDSGYLPNETPRYRVISHALDLLTSIHSAYSEQPVQISAEDHVPLTGQEISHETTKQRQTLHTLLDLVACEGIYPSLTPGVGIPLEKRFTSILPAGPMAWQHVLTDDFSKADKMMLLDMVLIKLMEMIRDTHHSIQPIIIRRLLPDILCGTAEMGFYSDGSRGALFRDFFYDIIQRSSTPELLPVLSLLLKESSEKWFKAQVASQLSRIPLRKDGVFQILLFLASEFAPALGQNSEATASSGPPITVQAILHASRLLSSVPADIPAEEYFSNIAPKLLALLDSKDPDMKKTASYVIGNGILNKSAYGRPGSIGFSIFLKPIFDTLNGKVSDASETWLKSFSLDGTSNEEAGNRNSSVSSTIPEFKLSLSLDRLSALSLSHPNPGLLKRLVNPTLMPLWGLQCYAKEHKKQGWEASCSSLLKSFFSISADASRLLKVADNLLWDGTSTWSYGPGEEGGISIRARENEGPAGIIAAMNNLGGRVDSLLELLGADPRKDELAGDIFLHVSRQWLLDDHSEDGTHGIPPELKKLVSAKIAEKLLDQFKDTLSRRPSKVLELIIQLIRSEKGRFRQEKTQFTGVSFSSLGDITKGEDLDDGRMSSLSDTDDLLSPALSLLSTILTSPEFEQSDSILPALRSLKSDIDLLLPSLPKILVQPATTASMLLEITLSNPTTSPRNDFTASDLELHRQALTCISSPLVPIKAEGLSLISQLINKASPILDIPATLTLLLSILTNDDELAATDEFLYLNVISVIGSLASRHPRTVIKTLAERYSDSGEELTVDKRLKIGEALLKTVQNLGSALVEDTAGVLGDTLIYVAGRRPSKPKAKVRREEKKKKSHVPFTNCDNPGELDTMNSDTEDPIKGTEAKRIIESWEAGAGSDEAPEDLRIRTSAISILSSTILANLASLGVTRASASVELALSTLRFEREPDSAILRRAAVILLLDILSALDKARESGRDLGFGFRVSSSIDVPVSAPGLQTSIGNIPDILRILREAHGAESDQIVRGHLSTLIENFENWLEKSLLWEIRSQQGFGSRVELGDRLAGLDIAPLSSATRKRGEGAPPLIKEID